MAIATQQLNAKNCDSDEWSIRVDLAAAFRLAVHFDWHESVANHFSATIGGDGKYFLLNPKWRHFSTIRASDLLLLSTDDTDLMSRPDAPDASAWCIHGAVHRDVPHARVLLHCHPAYATALSTLKDPEIQPIDQVTASFFRRMAIDLEFGGIADQPEEGTRIAKAFGNHSVMMMGNHGVSVAAETVPEAFEKLYNLERAARTMMLAYATGQPLNVMSDDLAEKTAAGWDDFSDVAFAHFDALKAMLDSQDPSYRE